MKGHTPQVISYMGGKFTIEVKKFCRCQECHCNRQPSCLKNKCKCCVYLDSNGEVNYTA